MKPTSELLSRTFLDYEALGAHQAISAIYLFDRAPDAALLRKRVDSVPRTFPELTGAVTLAMIDEQQHVNQFASTALSTGLDFPKEKLRFVAGPVNGGYAIAGIIHHSVADGLGGMETMKRLFLDPEERDAEFERGGQTEFDRTAAENFSYAKAITIAQRYLLSPARSAKQTSEPHPSRQRELFFLLLDKDRLKELKRLTGTSLNELFLFGVRGVLRRLDRGAGEENILLPVNLRPRQLRLALGNYLLAIPIPVTLAESSARKALEEIRTRTRSLTAPASIESWRAAQLFVCSLPRIFRRAALRKIAAKLRCIATYVPQKSARRQIGEATLVEQYGFPALLPGHELGFALMTYQERFAVTVVTAGGLLGRSAEFGRFFGEEMERLSAELERAPVS